MLCQVLGQVVTLTSQDVDHTPWQIRGVKDLQHIVIWTYMCDEMQENYISGNLIKIAHAFHYKQFEMLCSSLKDRDFVDIWFFIKVLNIDTMCAT